jgi:uncharacterized repeat protein (TIGR01451 family)
MLVMSLVMAIGAPMSAQPQQEKTLDVDLNAWVKCGMDISPLQGCLDPCNDFLINAAISAPDGTCNDVQACITIEGNASLDPCETECKVVDNIPACSVQDVWWKLHCDGPGTVTITVDVTAADAEPASDTTYVGQCQEAPCPVLEVEVIECAGEDCGPDCPDCIPSEDGIYVEVSEVFGVKAVISFADCPRSISNVVATIDIDKNAVLVPGMPDHWDLGDMDPGDEHEVGWTVHCTNPGDVCITVNADFDGEGPDEVISDQCKVHQEVPACLLVTITDPSPGEEICAGCPDVYQVCATVSNPCDVDAENVFMKVSANGTGGVNILDPTTKIVGDLIAGGDFSWCWDYQCTGVGDVTFTVEAEGTEVGTNADLAHSASVSIDQVPFMVDITSPSTSTTYSTCQDFTVTADIRNCLGQDINGATVTISWEPPTGASWVSGDPVTQQIDICNCDPDDFEWVLHCDEPGDLDITVTVSHSCCEDFTDTITVHQELKPHLVGGLDTYFQCCDCDIMEPISAFDVGQVFHVVAPICNTGEADAVDVVVEILVTGPAHISGGANPQTIPRIPGGECRKAFWEVECDDENDVDIEIVVLEGTDENTGELVPEPNICWCCPVEVKQIPVDIEFIQPYDSQMIPPCEFFTVKAEICNEDSDDTINGVTAMLYWTGNAVLADGQPNPVPVENLLPGECAEATWEMHCEDWGDVTFWLCVRAEDPGMCFEEPGPTMHQDVPDTCLCVDILSPEMGAIYATSQEFAVTATVRNNYHLEQTAYDVVLSIDGYGFDVVACDGCPVSPQADVDLGEIEPGGSRTVTWTVHCNEPGLTFIKVSADAWNICGECDCHDLVDLVTVWQYPASHLEVEVLEVLPDTTVTVCDEFDVVYKVANTGEADATEVELILSVTPDGSARPVAGIDNGYTKYIGTLPGHGQDAECIGTWRLHCKEACESTINITATGLDEYGYHKKQECQSTGSFLVETGCEVIEALVEDSPEDNKGWVYGFFIGEASGLSGPFSINTPVSWAMEGGGPDYTGTLVAMGALMPDIDHHLANLLPWFMCECCDEEWDCENKDLLFFVGHIVTDGPWDMLPDLQEFCVGDGLLQSINGVVTGSYFTYILDQPGGPPVETWIKSLLGGTYCSTLAAESLRPINENFIEDAWVTVKQLPANADLSILKEADPEEVHVTGDVTLTITVTNNGPSDATSILVSDVLPVGISYVSCTASQGWYDVTSGIWDVGDLAEGESAVLTIEAVVNVADGVCNRATIVAADQHDPVTGNNSSEACIASNPSNPHGNISLDEGYNLISPSLIPETPDAAVMMTGLDFLQVAKYVADGNPTVDDWFYYNPPPAPSDLTGITDGWGYWINMASPGVLEYQGYSTAPPPPALPPSYDVVPGWNLIGFTSIEPKSAAVYLAGIAGTYGPIYGFGNGAYFIVGTSGHELLELGHGYWIAIFEAGTIYP